MRVYLDHNAGTPLDPRVLAAMSETLAGMPGNPSSSHQFGRAARAQLEQARLQVAALVKVQPTQVVFTSGGTEANNLALRALCADRSGGRLAVSAIEHPSVLEPARALQKLAGWSLDLIGADNDGRITTDAFAAALRPGTRLASVMLANNETGVVQPVAELAGRARAAGVVMHTDAVQAAGKLALDFDACGVQLMTLSAHKIYGPKGAGALIFDKSLEIAPLLRGGAQEGGLRAGTENIAAIVGFGLAAELAAERLEEQTRLRRLRDQLQTGLKRHRQVTVFAENAPRLPNTLQFAVAGLDGETLLMQLDKAGIAVSSGSACASGSSEPSHVLLAMGVDAQLSRGAVRVSLGGDNTQADIDRLLAVLAEKIEWLNKAAQVAGW